MMVTCPECVPASHLLTSRTGSSSSIILIRNQQHLPEKHPDLQQVSLFLFSSVGPRN